MHEKQDLPTSMEYDFLFKVIAVGDSSVGKTNILTRFTQDKFLEDSKATIGVEFFTKNVRLKDGKVAKAQIWDTAGQEKYRTITTAYYRGAHGAFIVYDITSPASFESASEKWLQDIREMVPGNGIPIVLVGNKTDLEADRKVSVEEGKKLAEENDMAFIETSAKEGTNIIEAFEILITHVQSGAPGGITASYGPPPSSKLNDKDTVKLESEPIDVSPKPNSKCC